MKVYKELTNFCVKDTNTHVYRIIQQEEIIMIVQQMSTSSSTFACTFLTCDGEIFHDTDWTYRLRAHFLTEL